MGQRRATGIAQSHPPERHPRGHPLVKPKRQRLDTQPVIWQGRADLLLCPLAKPTRRGDPRRQHRDKADTDRQNDDRAAKADLPDMMQHAAPGRHACGGTARQGHRLRLRPAVFLRLWLAHSCHAAPP